MERRIKLTTDQMQLIADALEFYSEHCGVLPCGDVEKCEELRDEFQNRVDLDEDEE